MHTMLSCIGRDRARLQPCLSSRESALGGAVLRWIIVLWSTVLRPPWAAKAQIHQTPLQAAEAHERRANAYHRRTIPPAPRSPCCEGNRIGKVRQVQEHRTTE